MKNELKVGITIVAALLLLSAVLWWAKDVQIGNVKRIGILFPNVSGLQIGDPVTMNGVKLGSVESMQVISHSGGQGVSVGVQLPPDLPLYRDASARLMMLEVLTGKKIELSSGTAALGDLREGDLIRGRFTADIPELVGFVGEAIDTLRLIISEVQTTLQNANTLLGDAGVQSDVRETLKNLRSATGDFASVARTLRGTDLKGLLAKVDRTIESISQIADDLRPELKSTVSDIRSTLKDARELIGSINGITAKLNDDRPTLVNKLLNDTTFTARIDTVVAHLDSLLKLGAKDGMKVQLRLF